MSERRRGRVRARFAGALVVSPRAGGGRGEQRQRGAVGTAAPRSRRKNAGVTAKQIKVGIALVDFDCIKDVHRLTIRTDQEKIYQAFIDDINEQRRHRGPQDRAGVREVLPDRQRGDAGGVHHVHRRRQGVRRHRNVLRLLGRRAAVRHQAAPDRAAHVRHRQGDASTRSPPGPDRHARRARRSAPRRSCRASRRSENTFDGKKVAVLGERHRAPIVNDSIVPALKELGVDARHDRVLNIQGTDTSPRRPARQLHREVEDRERRRHLPLGLRASSAKQFVRR